MRTPSIATLRDRLNLSPIQAKQAKAILTASRAYLAGLPAGAARLAACYNPPATSDLRMTCLDALLDTFGVEAFEAPGGWLEYLNTSDSYAPTIVRYPSGTYAVACWGDIAEGLL